MARLVIKHLKFSTRNGAERLDIEDFFKDVDPDLCQDADSLQKVVLLLQCSI